MAYFPGLAAPQTLDVDSLPVSLAQEIELCIEELAAEGKADTHLDAPNLRDDIFHSVIVEQPDGQFQRFEGPPTQAMRKLVSAIRAGLRTASERSKTPL